jgi:hypothetical protein
VHLLTTQRLGTAAHRHSTAMRRHCPHQNPRSQLSPQEKVWMETPSSQSGRMTNGATMTTTWSQGAGMTNGKD